MRTIVLWMAKRCYGASDHVPPHYHNFWHLIYVLEANGTIDIGGVPHPTECDVVYVIPGDVIHAIYPASPDKLKTIEAKFTVTDPRMSEQLGGLLRTFHDNRHTIKSELEVAFDEGLRKAVFYRELMNVRIEGILYSLAQRARETGVEESPSIPGSVRASITEDPRPDFSKVVDEILRYHHTQIRLCDLASLVHLNESYFSRTFQREFGVPPIQYLLDVRIDHARRLLIESEDTVSEIADKCGFGSIHYFSRYFKKRLGISPREFREKFPDTHYVELDHRGYTLHGTQV